MNKNPLTKKIIFNFLKKIKRIDLGREKLTLEDSTERFLDEKLVSKINLPPFNNSAVDGYALVKSDISKKNICLTINTRIAAGDIKKNILKKGEVARIFTGAQMPENSKTVIMQENINLYKNKIRINKIPFYGENCRLAGEDIKKGRTIFSNGSKINSSNVNLIAAIGKSKIYVRKKINIGFYTSGNELRKPTEKLKNSQINNSNFYSLNSLLNKPYIKRKYLGILKDKERIIEKSFLQNANKYNVIITTGGASVGEEDHLIRIIKKLGKIYFWKTAIKPGRPLAIGKIKNTIFICLPGNPVSVHLLYGMIIKPFIEYLCGAKLISPKGIRAKADFIMNKKNKRMEWLRVKINHKKKDFVVSKYNKQGSGMISSIVFTDGILEIPEDVRLISKNDYFNFYSFKSLFN